MGRLLLLIIFTGWVTPGQVVAQPAEPLPEMQGSINAPSAEDLRALADLLRKPTIQAWLEKQAEAGMPSRRATIAAQPADVQQTMAGRLDATRAFLRELVATVPTLPAELGRARTTLMAELSEQGPFAILLPLGLFAALGFGFEWLFWRATAGLRSRIIASALDTAGARLRAVGLRMLYGLGLAPPACVPCS